MNKMWQWIKSWFVRKPKFTELEIDDDDREMQKEPLLYLPMEHVTNLSTQYEGEPSVQVH